LEGGFLGKGGNFPARDRSATGGQFAHCGTPLRLTMSVVYSLYDALVSINVPDDKAKAVIDAMEREFMDKVATKADLEHLRAATKADIEHLRELLSRDIAAVNERIANQTHTITLRLILTAVGLVPAIIAAQKLF
jgi:hypothetical protein